MNTPSFFTELPTTRTRKGRSRNTDFHIVNIDDLDNSYIVIDNPSLIEPYTLSLGHAVVDDGMRRPILLVHEEGNLNRLRGKKKGTRWNRPAIVRSIMATYGQETNFQLIEEERDGYIYFVILPANDEYSTSDEDDDLFTQEDDRSFYGTEEETLEEDLASLL